MIIYKMLLKSIIANNDETAIIYNNEYISYKELGYLIERIKNNIVELNIQNCCIAIVMKRSPLMIASLFAVLASENYFVLIDPENPKERNNCILNDNQVAAIISDVERITDWKNQKDVNITISINKKDRNNYLKYNNVDKIAYCIYTSGSTGKPKGVLIGEQALANFLNSLKEKKILEKDSRILCATTQGFDIFILESVFSLIEGKIIVLANDLESKNPRKLIKLARSGKVTVVQMTPSRLRIFLELDPLMENFQHVKCFLIGGEQFTIDLLKKLRNVTNAQIYNLYGPTETTVWSSMCNLTNKNYISIGEPLSNTEFIICDENGNKVKDGTIGELYIGGNSVALGYYDDIQNTKKKFVNVDGKKFFKSGDLARRLYNGEYEVLGRKDNQVKINGYRIELEEIESIVLEKTEITKCIASPLKNGNRIAGIKLYYYAASFLDKQDIIKILRLYLPNYMIPLEYYQVMDFYYTSSGKIDRSKTDELKFVKKNIHIMDDTKLDNTIQKLIEDITGRNITVDDNIGLKDIVNSLEFIQLILKIEEYFNIEIEDEFLVLNTDITLKKFILILKKTYLKEGCI